MNLSSCADSDRLEHQLEEAVSLRQDYESSASRLKTLEKTVKTLRQEKDDVHKVSADGHTCLTCLCLSVRECSGSVHLQPSASGIRTWTRPL